MTTLFLSRHGETVWHAENRYAGISDVGLTENGHAQARQLGSWASGAELDALVSSTLSRSVLTAAPASDETALPLVQDERLVEVDFGSAEGLTRDDMRSRFPDALDAFLAKPGTTPLPNGESGTDAVARALPAIRDICDALPNGRVLVVMHSTLMRLLLCRFLGLNLDRYRRALPSVRNCAMTAFRLPDDGEPELLAFNVPPDTGTRLG